jgi:alpha-ketoglutarate-dependent taurine dioxygenase
MIMTETLAAPAALDIRQLAGNIGAELRGVDAAAELSDETVARVRAALLRHKVVFLRDQRLDYDRQVACASAP